MRDGVKAARQQLILGSPTPSSDYHETDVALRPCLKQVQSSQIPPSPQPFEILTL